MKRREFLASAALSATALAATSSAVEPSTKREFIELRMYTVKDDEKRDRLVEVLDTALIPAMNAQGIKPVGVFQFVSAPTKPDEKFRNCVFVVLPHRTLDSSVALSEKLLADEAYRKNAAPVFSSGSKDPLYLNCETQLLHCFETAPTLETPELGKDRVFQLRLYRSCNSERNAAKIHMFDHGGELPTFREVGLHPVFFGEAMAGRMMPNLSYMIGCESREKHDAAWKTFAAHPTWQRIKDLPEYADTATEIDRVVLIPSPGSQI